MKKPSLCCIALVIILGALAFFEIRDTRAGNEYPLLDRMFFSNRGYAENIEVKSYLLTVEQVVDLLQHPQMSLQQPMKKELCYKNTNVVLRVKNHGELTAWGTLAYNLGYGHWFKIDVYMPSMNSRESMPFYEFVIPVGIRVPDKGNEPPRPIEIKWISLYTKP